MNVYLHKRDKFRAYLQRLQNQADEKPLLLGEYGIDSIRNGGAEQAEMLDMHLEEVFRLRPGGHLRLLLHRRVVHGRPPDQRLGLRPGQRRAQAKAGVPPGRRESTRRARCPRLPRYPKVSVVVCSYNGAKTLDGCLRSLQKLNYPDYEAILVDDGSKDSMPEIAKRYPHIRYFRQDNKGLSVARNVGMELATGEIIAYTDDDCFADEDWLYFLVCEAARLRRLGRGRAEPAAHPRRAGGGLRLGEPGHAGPHPDRRQRRGARARLQHGVLGRPAARHRRLRSRIHRGRRRRGRVLAAAGGGRAHRLQPGGDGLAPPPRTVRAYLGQQRGYGTAEALLKRKHPEKFRGFRADLSWHGRIYTRAGLGLNIGEAGHPLRALRRRDVPDDLPAAAGLVAAAASYRSSGGSVMLLLLGWRRLPSDAADAAAGGTCAARQPFLIAAR